MSLKHPSVKGIVSLSVSVEHLVMLLKKARHGLVDTATNRAAKAALKEIKRQPHLSIESIKSMSKGAFIDRSCDPIQEPHIKGILSLAVSREHFLTLLDNGRSKAVDGSTATACANAIKYVHENRHLTLKAMFALSRRAC